MTDSLVATLTGVSLTALLGAAVGFIRMYLQIQANATEIAALKADNALLWRMLEPSAIERLHHEQQPVLDALLEAWQAGGELTTPQLLTLSDRLTLLAQRDGNPDAQALLRRVKPQLDARMAARSPLTVAEQGTETAHRAEVAHATEAEAETTPRGAPSDPLPDPAQAAYPRVPGAGASP